MYRARYSYQHTWTWALRWGLEICISLPHQAMLSHPRPDGDLEHQEEVKGQRSVTEVQRFHAKFVDWSFDESQVRVPVLLVMAFVSRVTEQSSPKEAMGSVPRGQAPQAGAAFM